MTTTTQTQSNPYWDEYLFKLTPEYAAEAQRLFQQGPADLGPSAIEDFDPVRAAGINKAITAADTTQQGLTDAQSGLLTGILSGTDAGTQQLAQQACLLYTSPSPRDS